jgi:hypothetical protein
MSKATATLDARLAQQRVARQQLDELLASNERLTRQDSELQTTLQAKSEAAQKTLKEVVEQLNAVANRALSRSMAFDPARAELEAQVRTHVSPLVAEAQEANIREIDRLHAELRSVRSSERIEELHGRLAQIRAVLQCLNQLELEPLSDEQAEQRIAELQAGLKL